MEWQNKRKPTDRSLEPKVTERLPNAQLFQKLQEAESNLDALVQRKRLDLQDMIGRSMRKSETLRIFVSSQVFNQSWQEGTVFHTDGSNPTWTLRIEGRLLQDSAKDGRAFSSMITSVIVDLNKQQISTENQREMQVEEPVKNEDARGPNVDAPADFGNSQSLGDGAASLVPTPSSLGAGLPSPSVSATGAAISSNDSVFPPVSSTNSSTETPNNAADSANTDDPNSSNNASQADETVEWHESCVPPEQRVDFDGLDVKRNGSDVVEATIFLQLKEYPDKCKLSPQLADILGVTEESKPGAVVSLWQYARYHNLQDVDEKRLIKCDEALFKLFKREKIMLPQLVELLTPHLTPREPIKINYTIDPTQDMENRDLVFDVPIQLDHPLRGDLLRMLNNWHHDHGELSKLEDLLLRDVQSLNLMSYQREFYEQFAADPVNLLERWTASQARDLRIIYCDRQFNEEAVRQSSFYTDDLLNANLHLFVEKQ